MGALRRSIGIVLSLLTAAGVITYWYAHTLLPIRTLPIAFTVAPNSSLPRIAQGLVQAGILPNAWPFQLLARAMGRAAHLQAGSYQLTTAPTLLGLLNQLSTGRDPYQSRLTIIEGWTMQQLRDAMDHSADLRHYTTGLSDDALLAQLQLPYTQLEGIFFPDTYHFPKGSDDLQLLRRAALRMHTLLQREWAMRRTQLPYKTPYEALIMASLIEKETGHPIDRPTVAAVFLNRLRYGMRLQTDPSVIYGVGAAYPGRLQKQHLLTDTPYNTYTRAGLPPSPIALPGLASLRAAMQPAASSALYFVARGDGRSQFSQSLAEHNRAVRRFVLGRER